MRHKRGPWTELECFLSLWPDDGPSYVKRITTPSAESIEEYYPNICPLATHLILRACLDLRPRDDGAYCAKILVPAQWGFE